jgi:hypothetical protein
MVWGAFAGAQKSDLVPIPKNKRTAKDFVEIVYEGQLRKFLGEIFGGVLMEDGAPVHRSGAPQRWRELFMVQKLEWPANSPDLNPIENIWFSLKDAVPRRRNPPRSVEQMMEAVKSEWEAITKEKLEQLIATMPQRIRDVIEARGGHTRW